MGLIYQKLALFETVYGLPKYSHVFLIVLHALVLVFWWLANWQLKNFIKTLFQYLVSFQEHYYVLPICIDIIHNHLS